MSFATLLRKLIQIETAAAAGDLGAVHALTIEAEELLLRLESHLIDQLKRPTRSDMAA